MASVSLSSPAQHRLLHSQRLPPELQLIDLPSVDVSAVVPTDTPFLTHLCLIVQHSLLSFLKTALLDLNNPKALITDLFCTQAFEICKDLSIPVYTFYTASATFLAFSLHLPQLDRAVECEFVDLPEPIQIPAGCSSVRIEDLQDDIRNRKIDEYKWSLFLVSRLPMATGILVNTWEDLEPISIRAMTGNSFFQQIPTPPIYPIGRVIKVAEPISASDNECLAWLNKQPPDSVLLVSLGSGGALTGEQLTELAWGLEMSKQRFVWVVRMPSNASACSTFFSDANDPKAYLPEGFLNKTRGVGLVVPSWAPQVAVLSHPSTRAFLSHCGWNSSLEAMAHGVPMIAWPLYAEQRINATMLAEEVGVAVKPMAEPGKRIVERKEIDRVVRMMMEGEEGKIMRNRANELKDSGAKALLHGGSSHDSLSRVANQWKVESKT